MNNKPKWIIIVLLGLAVLTHGQPLRRYLERGIGVRDSVTLGESRSEVAERALDSSMWAFDWRDDNTVAMIKYTGRIIPTEKLVRVGMPENAVRRRYGRPLNRKKASDDGFDLLFYHGIVFKIAGGTVTAIIIIPIEKAEH